MQAVRKRGLCEERPGTGPPVLPLPGVRLPLHRHAFARQAACDDGAGGLFTGKDLTPIEQDNSNVRHCLARFRRRTKVVSKCRTMVDLSLRLLHHPEAFASYAKRLVAVFG